MQLIYGLLEYISLAYPGLCKKIDKLAKKKDYDEVGEWCQSISNHMYWCAASTPDGNGEVIQEKWKILPLHIQNIHVNAESDLYPECGRGNLQGDAADRLWLRPGADTNADRMQAVTDEGRPRYSVVFPKAKKGDHAIRKIKTQASYGGYDVDGAQEVRDCTF